ncbi:MAG: hypothetical protein J7L66_01045, partial [Anaerolineaceae bacterium]|nr:hypothetical protein [Anaerolineaceae bacterium]
MKKRFGLIKKITNVFGILFVMLGAIPVPVLSQIGTAYAEVHELDGAAVIDLPAFTSNYTELLGSTVAESDSVELDLNLPDISSSSGDWISLAILGPITACEGEDCEPEVPAEEGGEAPPAEELPVEEDLVEEETPDENDLCPDDESKLVPGVCGCGVSDRDSDADGIKDCEDACPQDALNECTAEPSVDEPEAECEGECAPDTAEEQVAEETPDGDDLCPDDEFKLEPGVCGCGVSDGDSDADGIKDCEDACPQDALNECTAEPSVDETETECEGECAPGPAEEQAEEAEVVVAEVVEAAAEKDVVFADNSGDPLEMASQETADLLVEADDPWYVDAGDPTIIYGFSSTGVCVTGVTNCITDPNPIQAAINHAPAGTTIYIKTDSYNSTVDVTKVVTLHGVQGSTVSDLADGDVTINTINLFVDIPDWFNIYVANVNVMNDTAEIQDGIDIAEDGGVVNVSEGTYEEELVIDKPLILNGNVGSPAVSGPGKDAPVLEQGGTWQTGTGIDLSANNVTIQGFVFKGYQYDIDINSMSGVNINNNMFLYLPPGGEAIKEGPASVDAYNIEFPAELNGKFYNNECSQSGNCTKVEGDANGQTFWYSADVVLIKTGSSNGFEFFFTRDTQECNPSVDFYCVTWNADGSITIHTYQGQTISHAEFWNFNIVDPECGDGNLDPGEQCDDGNNLDGDGCSATCTIEPGCGNGILESGETCEVGEGGDWGDCREGLCTYCGDGNLDDGEA